MITPDEAEVLAQQTVERYVNACDIKTQKDMVNVLLKLAGKCGLAMCEALLDIGGANADTLS